MENKIPAGWERITLENLELNFFKGVNVSSKGNEGEYLFIPSGANFPAGIKLAKAKWISKEEYNKIAPDKILKDKDILFNSGGVGTLGRSSFYRRKDQHAVCDSFIIIIRDELKQTNMKYLFYWLQSSQAEEFIEANTKGTTGITSIKSSDIKSFEIPLPPFLEQHRIVTKLDALMEKVEINKPRLDKIPLLLKRFRQSLLAAAVSGRLTKDWRNKNGIIDEWKSLKAIDACSTVACGSTPKGKPFYEKEEIPYLKVYNIVNQTIDFFYKPQYIKKIVHQNELKRCRVYSNDVIINIVGPPLGKVALIPETFSEWNINQAIVLFRPKEFLLAKFLYFVLCDGKQIKDIELELRGTVGQSNISLTQCRDFDFPIPDIQEQKEIVHRVEQLFTFVDELECRYWKAKALLDKLPQSILSKAFRGELVLQDPNDEPASLLLQRIKAEKIKIKEKNQEKIRKRTK